MKKLFLFLLLFSPGLLLLAQKEKLQTAYILNFTKYIQWCPDLSGGSFVIGVIGDSPILSELNVVAQSKKVGSQSIVVKKLSSSADISKCSIVFIPENKSGQLDAVIGKIGGDCTLIITEKNGLAKNGSAINFIEVDGKIYFEINKTSFSSHSLQINSQLVNLAKVVYN